MRRMAELLGQLVAGCSSAPRPAHREADPLRGASVVRARLERERVAARGPRGAQAQRVPSGLGPAADAGDGGARAASRLDGRRSGGDVADRHASTWAGAQTIVEGGQDEPLDCHHRASGSLRAGGSLRTGGARRTLRQWRSFNQGDRDGRWLQRSSSRGTRSWRAEQSSSSRRRLRSPP